MNFVIDECVSRDVVDYLELLGYDVKYVTDYSPGISDEDVKQLAYENDSVIFTLDKKGFTDYKLSYLMGDNNKEEVYRFLKYMT